MSVKMGEESFLRVLNVINLYCVIFAMNSGMETKRL